MRSESTRHHMLWRRTDYRLALERRVRGAFIVPALQVNHRLLHLMMSPPEKPSHETLWQMRGCETPEEVIDRIDDPIADHFAEQLGILALPRDDAYKMLNRRLPKEYDSRVRRASGVIVAMLADDNDPAYHPSPVIVEDTAEGWDVNGDWHAAPVGGRWDDAGDYFDRSSL